MILVSYHIIVDESLLVTRPTKVKSYSIKNVRLFAPSAGNNFYEPQLMQSSCIVQVLSPVGRAGNADEVANVAALLMTCAGSFITGSDFLMDGGVTASYFYGELAPKA